MQVDLTLPEQAIQEQFPLFPGLHAAAEVTLTGGQMLFLPAGWFHEVTSFTAADSDTHVALNYWFHPPDTGAAGTLAHPYSSDFWPSLWNARVHRHSWGLHCRVPRVGDAETAGRNGFIGVSRQNGQTRPMLPPLSTRGPPTGGSAVAHAESGREDNATLALPAVDPRQRRQRQKKYLPWMGRKRWLHRILRTPRARAMHDPDAV